LKQTVRRKILKKGDQLRANFVKDKNGNPLAAFHILNRWKTYFCQPLNVHEESDVIHSEI
jgi:hypothetical protein